VRGSSAAQRRSWSWSCPPATRVRARARPPPPSAGSAADRRPAALAQHVVQLPCPAPPLELRRLSQQVRAQGRRALVRHLSSSLHRLPAGKGAHGEPRPAGLAAAAAMGAAASQG
jgi:hypothetical protein